MNSTTRKISPSEWERHKDTILELYRNKPLKGVRAAMLDVHAFNASPWQYEMQFKRWGVRKNANRDEWQHYFSTKKDLSIPNSLDVPGESFSPVILNKSTKSKKRASRWVSDCIVASDAGPAHQPSASIPNENEETPLLSLNEPRTQPDVRGFPQNIPGHSQRNESFQLLNEPDSPYNFTHSLLGSPSEVFVDALSIPENPLDFSLTLSVLPGLQSPVYELENPDLADFPVMGLPAWNNTAILILQDIGQILPFAQLEQSILSRGIVLERSAGHNIFGGFAPRVVAGFLSSKDQSMVRKAPDLQRSLRMLSTQIPGASSALITDDQAFETKFARELLFSVLNGFTGLDGIPMENIFRFLNRILVNKLLLDVLEQSPRYVSRTLADNIFRAAIEATDTKVVNLLLSRRLVDVNETVCFHKKRWYTPIQRASALRSLNLMRSLIDAGADVNKSHESLGAGKMGGALITLISDLITPNRRLSETEEWPTIQSESIEALKMLVAVGVQMHSHLCLRNDSYETKELQFLMSQTASLESHRDFFQRHESFISLIKYLDDRRATRLVHNLISLCHQADCNKCLGGLGDDLGITVPQLASDGKLGLIQLLFQEVDVKPNLSQVFLAAIRSKNPALIDFILSLGPDLDPPAMHPGLMSSRHTTPIAEAVGHGNEHLIRLLEAEGCLDHLTEGGRFGAVVAAAAEAGNATYMRKLLTRAVSSKEAYRVTDDHLKLALEGNHQDIAQMLLEAGARAYRISLPGTSIIEDLQILHRLMKSGSWDFDRAQDLAQKDRSIVAVLINEFPDFHFQFNDSTLPKLLRKCIDTDMLDFFREVLQTLDLNIGSLNSCLLVAVESGHSNLVEYLLDMGANSFHDSVLRAAVRQKPDMLRLLLQKERRRQTSPKCIGARVLEPLMGNGAGDAEALDELVRTGAINFVRLEALCEADDEGSWIFQQRREYRSSIRFTPLGMAIQGVPGRFDSNMVAMRKFLEAGADPNEISKYNQYWDKGSPLMTALMVAIETGLEDAVNILLDYGADLNARPRIGTTRTALQFAAELGNMDMLRLVLSRGADPNSSASPRGGATALQFAAMAGNCNMVACLLDHGAQLDALPSRIDGMWPLEGAAANGRLDMVRFLWELNARAVAGGTFPDGFLERHCLRAMDFAWDNGHIGCRDLISDLSGISVDRLETDEYGAPWIAY